MSEKTEKPTPKRLRDARKKGQIARSRLFSSAAVTLGGLVGALLAVPDAWQRMHAWTSALLLSQDVAPGAALAESGRAVLALAAPSLLGALAAALGVSVATAGFHVEISHVSPRFDRVSIGEGLTRLFDRQRLFEMGRGLLVIPVLGVMVFSAVRSQGPALLGGVWRAEGSGLCLVFSTVGTLALRATVVLTLLGIGDFLLTRWSHLRSLMMTREEVKQEQKDSEGDPHQKAKRRAVHRQLAGGGPARGVQKATAVVVNPTHIAVALRYSHEECDAPYLVAKGRDADAFAIRREAERLGIPVVRDVPLARSLAGYDVGEEIPEELYQAAAAVLHVAMSYRDSDGSPGERT